MKQSILRILLTFLVLLGATGAVSAAEPAAAPTPEIDPFAVGCGPEDTCHVPPDIMTAKIPLSKSDITISDKPIEGLQKTAIMNWFGYVRPDGEYHITSPKFEAYGTQVQKASDLDLNPAYFQDTEQHDTTPKQFSITARLCVTNPETGGLAGNFVTEKLIKTKDEVPGLRDTAESNRRLASMTTRYVQLTQDYRLPNLLVKKEDPLPCGASAGGEILDQRPVAYLDENLFGEQQSAITRILYTITADIIEVITKFFVDKETGEVSEETFYRAQYDVPARYVSSGQNQWMGPNLCLGGGCPNADDLEPVKYLTDAQKAKLQESGGWINSMYRPDAMDPNYKAERDAVQQAQGFEVTIVNKKVETDTHHYALNRVEAAGTYANCTLINAALQKGYYPSGECDQNWAASTQLSSVPAVPPGPITSSTAYPGEQKPASCQAIMDQKQLKRNVSTGLDTAMNEAAGWANINPCILRGVAEIEGAREEIASGQCSPNRCSATGPFQITTGFTLEGKGAQCSENASCSQCGGLTSCPNAVDILSGFSALKAKFGDNLNPCDTRVAAHMAASLLVGKASYFKQSIQGNINDPAVQKAIITAGDSYYGVSRALDRPGPWQGLSYGEYVLSQCVPGVTHTEHNFPSSGSQL